MGIKKKTSLKSTNQLNEFESYLESHVDDLMEVTDFDRTQVEAAAKKDMARRRQKAQALQKTRKEKLGLTQAQMARAVGAKLRTFQSWERGRQSAPRSVEILTELMVELPSVRNRLIVPRKGKGSSKSSK